MKPIIGVTPSVHNERTFTVTKDVIASVTHAGGMPVILPHFVDQELIRKTVNTIDGLLLTGGGDIDPTLFGEEPHPQLGLITPERDQFETKLIQLVLEEDKPILAICRGCQILNIATGGDMYQHIYDQVSGSLLQHEQQAPRAHGSHYVQIERDSLLMEMACSTSIRVNSYHHQAVRHLGEIFKVSATASDGLIEAFESTRHPFVIGVQWHPENMWQAGDKPSLRLFHTFVQYCQKQN